MPHDMNGHVSDDIENGNGRFDWRARYHLPITLAAYTLIFSASLFGAFALAYNFHRFGIWSRSLFPPLAALAIPIKLVVFGRMRLYRGSWRYVGLHDLQNVVWASHISSFFFVGSFFLLEIGWSAVFDYRLIDRSIDDQLRQSVFLIDWAATIGLVSLCRVVVRLYHEEVNAEPFETHSRVLIVGAAESGEAVLRQILRQRRDRYDVVGFLDDDPTQLHRTIHGVEVLGRFEDIKAVCDRHTVDEILIALPKATPKEIRGVVEICEGENLRFRIVPAVADLIEGRLQVSQFRDVDIEDLLGRAPVTLDTEAIAAQIADKRILVTGAGGSIGSEVCRQIARFKPQRLILLEQAENNLFEIERELRRRFDGLTVVPYVADICDSPRVRSIVRRQKPTAIFHAAAHKHVPMMELNPGEAVKNNVIGSRNVADAAVEFGVDKMVMISTDKAVNPSSIMGCTKRVAELYVQQLGDQTKTQFITVRFGNVLGSSGSVVPIFRQQIARGGPVTVTHPDMMRYFMTISEASQLVLQAGTMGTGGEIFLLDMGDPIKIVDLARDMITLSGLRHGVDMEIVFTGTRPGEKLREELYFAGENVGPTKHPKIGIWRSRPVDFDRLRADIDALQLLVDEDCADPIRAQLARIVPEYNNGCAE